MHNSELYTADQIRAFTYAHKAEALYHAHSVPEATTLCYDAIRLDPQCLDAFRVLSRCMFINPQVDCDTIIGICREVLGYVRRLKVIRLLRENPGRATEVLELRPYIRAMHDMASCAVLSGNSDVALLAYEEILRSDYEDFCFVRELLMIQYIRTIGRALRNEVVFVERTVDHLNSLFDAILGGRPLWDGQRDASARRWGNLVLAYMRGEAWEPLAQAENKESPWVARMMFDETSKIPSDKDPDAARFAKSLVFGLRDWPDFVKRLHSLLRRPSQDFDSKADAAAPAVAHDLAWENKLENANMSGAFLEQGRQKHREKSYNDAITMLTLAKRSIVEAMRPSQRWYTNANFAIVSNRASCAEGCGHWWLCRVDTRMTLIMAPNHVRSYERLPRIADALHANDLKIELIEFVKTVKAVPDRPIGEWRRLARAAIALISIPAIMHSRMGTLTQELREELIEIGIEDIYTPVNVELDVLPPLPWLTEDDFEVL
jgi:hypothetical protein